MKTKTLFFRTVTVLIICFCQAFAPLHAGGLNFKGWKPLVKPFGNNGAGVTARTPVGKNGLNYEPFKKPFGNNGKNIEKWISNNRELCIFVLTTTVAILIAQPQLSALTWKSVEIMGGSNGITVGASFSTRVFEPHVRRRSDEPSGTFGDEPAPPSPEGAIEPPAEADRPPETTTEPPSNNDLPHSGLSGPSGRPFFGASNLWLAGRQPITLYTDHTGVPHVWLDGIRDPVTSDGATKALPFSFGPDATLPRYKRIETDKSTTEWELEAPPTESITFFVTSAQVKAMNEEVKRIHDEQGYKMITRNCTTEAVRVLRAAGIEFPSKLQERATGKTLLPYEVEAAIKLFKLLHPQIEDGYLPPLVAP